MAQTTSTSSAGLLNPVANGPLPVKDERRLRPEHIILALPVVLNALLYWRILLGGEEVAGDLVFHIPMVEWAKNQWLSGHIPLDGWFPNIGMGSSQFHHYQSLPHILTSLLAIVVGSKTAVVIVLFLLWSLWPVCLYWSARLFDRSRIECLALACLAPLLSTVSNSTFATHWGFDAASYLFRGMWPQLWAAWLMPLALALTWRSLNGKGKAWWAAVAVGACIWVDVLIGYFTLLLIVPIVLSSVKGLHLRMARAVLAVAGGLALAAWFLVPTISDLAYTAAHQFPAVNAAARLFEENSWGLPQVLAWAFNGEIMDGFHLEAQPPVDPGQLPVLSLLAAIGIIVVVLRWKRDPGGRALLLCAVGAICFYAGPATFPFLGWLPGSQFLEFYRFLGPLQLIGLFLAGTGAAAAIGKLSAWLAGLRLPLSLRDGAVGVAVGIVVLSPIFTHVNFSAVLTTEIDSEAGLRGPSDEANLNQVISRAEGQGPGRIYAGLSSGWGQNVLLGSVPVFKELALDGAPVIGELDATYSLASDAEEAFDGNKIGDYRVFDVRYLLLPEGAKPPVPATLLLSAAPYSLYEVNGASHTYTSVVDTVGPQELNVTNVNIGPLAATILEGADLQAGLYHPMQFAEIPAATPSWSGPGVPSGSPGSVLTENADLSHGHVVATVNVNRPAVALLSASLDNRWVAHVDGVETPIQAIAPAVIGVSVQPGSHTVEFEYVPYPFYWLWMLLGVLGLYLVSVLDRQLARWSPRSQESTDHN